MKNILVIGSANVDTTHYVDEFPTDLTKESPNLISNTTRLLGGKGANQAVSAALQCEGTENQVFFIGCVGQDDAGFEIIQNFKDKGVNFAGVNVLKGQSTDGRIVFVDKNGDNQMLGFGNCIKALTPESIFSGERRDVLRQADIVMIQLKMPEETIEKVIEHCENAQKMTLVDPTPIEKSDILVKKGLLDRVSFLSPNEEEAFVLAMYEEGKTLEEIKLMMKSSSREERLDIIRDLVERHPNVIATLGDRGVMYNVDGAVKTKEAYPTQCIDSTGAGDTFNGAFIAAISRGQSIEEAIDFALTDCAHKVRFKGAQNGMQTFGETAHDIYMRADQDLEK